MNSPLEEMRLNLSSLLESCHRSAWYLLASSNSLNWPLDEKDLALRRFLWSKGKFATEKENSGSVVFEASEASGIGLDGLDF
jgi:hypothetical protein